MSGRRVLDVPFLPFWPTDAPDQPAVEQRWLARVCSWLEMAGAARLRMYLERALIGYDLARRWPPATGFSTLHSVLEQAGMSAKTAEARVRWLMRPKQDCAAILRVGGGSWWILSLARQPGDCKLGHLTTLGARHGHSAYLIERLCLAFDDPNGGAAFFEKVDECIRAFPVAIEFKRAILELVDKHEVLTTTVVQ